MKLFTRHLNSMPKTYHHRFISRMVKRRNAYIEYCYAHGRRPVMPKVKTATANPCNVNNSFSSNPTRSRSHRKLVQPVIKSNRDKQLYFNRLPYLWNSLPLIDLSLSLDSIKRNLKELFWDSFLSKFDTSNSCTYHFSCPCSKCFSQPKSNFRSL